MTKQVVPLKGEELIQEIMRVALHHFAVKGFAAANMDEIAAELGINKPTIYYHIGKKEVLFDKVIDKALDDHVQLLEQKLNNADKPEDCLKAYIHAFAINFSGDNRYLANLILRQVATEDSYFPKSALQKMHRVQTHLWAILQRGMEQGVFRTVNPAIIHMLIVGFFTTTAGGDSMKNKIAESTDQDITHHINVDLLEAADIVFGMLMDTLKAKAE